ncbi:MAG TPA: hypothetical protein PLL09_00305 [Flavobacterium sp.]|uniref:hypothetical protein n=1 Tax=unclassified Flavobacterium TaxID=196869 RepID=UPI0025BDC153|nr:MULTISPECIES: hypothetical protein [unclassified Flavobacterium]HRE76241.1 hypothetical protein [Flavobacterium sp.]
MDKIFNNEEFKKSMGIKQRVLQPYNFERYKAVNPHLTEEVYKFIRQNSSEWKILCGLSVHSPWGVEILPEVWWLKGGEKYKETDFYKYRFVQEHYLNLTSW